jgi:hypothetical protein
MQWLFNTTRAIFQLYHGKNNFLFAKVQCNDHVCFVLDQHAELDFIVLAQWNNNLQIDISLHLDTLSW